MSSTRPSRPGDTSNLQQTRQLLDELDALMEKMLALPVSEVDEAAPPAPDIVRIPKVSATLTVLEAPAHDQDSTPEAASLIAPPAGSRLDGPDQLHQPHLTAVRGRAAEANYSLPDPADDPATLIPPSLLHVEVPEVEPLPQRQGMAVFVVLHLFIGINALYDLLTRCLGPLGRFLRSGTGRAMLGLVGVGLLIAAGGWLLADWMGWTW